jgi:RNA polymerase sigma-70 factor (ECF subfamily)
LIGRKLRESAVLSQAAEYASGAKGVATTDETLVRLFVDKGDQQAFAELMDRHLPPIRRMLIGMLAGDREEARDVEQETLVALLTGLRMFRFGSSFRTYLYRVARNKAVDAVRRSRREERAMNMWRAERTQESSCDPEQSLLEQEERTQARSRAMALLARLSPNERVLVLLREVEDLSLADISRTLNTRLGTVKSRLSRIRTKIERMAENDL